MSSFIFEAQNSLMENSSIKAAVSLMYSGFSFKYIDTDKKELDH